MMMRVTVQLRSTTRPKIHVQEAVLPVFKNAGSYMEVFINFVRYKNLLVLPGHSKEAS